METQTQTTTEDSSESLGAADAEALERKMPASLKAAEFVETFGRSFACPECGKPSTGTCDNCGHTHAAMRTDPSKGEQ